jgi:hypothetical protein
VNSGFRINLVQMIHGIQVHNGSKENVRQKTAIIDKWQKKRGKWFLLSSIPIIASAILVSTLVSVLGGLLYTGFMAYAAYRVSDYFYQYNVRQAVKDFEKMERTASG